MTTYNNLYLDIRRELARAGIAAASLEAREILCRASDKTKEEFLRDLGLYMGEEPERQARELLRRRLAGEPAAYLIGEWEFYGLPLSISPGVLIPRTDTEVLAEAAIAFVRSRPPGARVLDLCAGSGCVGLAVAANAPECRVLLADLMDEAIRLGRENTRRNELTARVSTARADARGKPPAAFGEFDCIVCNPPYIPSGEIEGLDPSVSRYEPRTALDGGEDGLAFFHSVASLWKQALKQGGRLLFECGAGQAPRVYKIMQLSGFGDIETIRDGQGIERVVSGRRESQI